MSSSAFVPVFSVLWFIGCASSISADVVPLDATDAALVDGAGDTRTRWKEIAVGLDTACGLTEDGRVYCWGRNYSMAVWNGMPSSATPRRITLASQATQVRVFQSSACAILIDQSLICWGNNLYGSLGRGTVTTGEMGPFSSGLEPGEALLRPVVSLREQGRGAICAVRTQGDAYCWGFGGPGQLGVPSAELRNCSGLQCSPTPRPMGLSARVRSITSNLSSVCAALEDGSVWCWGANDSGAFGNGVLLDGCPIDTCISLTPTRSLATRAVRMFSPSIYSMCALQDNGTLVCWGGGLNPSRNLRQFATPLPVPFSDRVVELGGTGRYACARLSNGETWYWGRQPFEDVPDGEPMILPPQREPRLDRFKSFGGFTFVSFGIDRDGAAWLWGKSTLLLGSDNANNDQWHGEPMRLPEPIE